MVEHQSVTLGSPCENMSKTKPVFRVYRSTSTQSPGLTCMSRSLMNGAALQPLHAAEAIYALSTYVLVSDNEV